MERKLTKKDKFALNTLDVYINELDSINEINCSAWKSKVLNSLINWLGDNNNQTILFNDKNFHEYIPGYSRYIFNKSFVNDFKAILNSIKHTIKYHGVLKEINWIYTANKALLWTISSAIVLSAFVGGGLVGAFIKNGWDYDIRQENKELRLRIDSVIKASKIADKHTQSDTTRNH